MSHPRYGDTDLTYWNGQPINAMTREDLQTALAGAIAVIDGQKNELIKLRHWYNKAMESGEFDEISASRYINPDYIASFV